MRVAQAMHHLYRPTPLGVTEDVNETAEKLWQNRMLTIIRADFAPLGFNVRPPILGLDKRPARSEQECEIAAVTA